eukprot:Skav226035  [mRNA]  locus=scaffold2502:131555:133492:- [translate_table: standard]
MAGCQAQARRFAQSKHFETVYALDILWAPLEAARASAEAEKPPPADGLWLLRGDAQSLPFKEKQLDTQPQLQKTCSMSTAAGFTNVSVECVGEGTMAERLVLRASAPEEKIS